MPAEPGREAILAILDLARWAPSGDNTQPWRFEVVDDRHVVVHGFDTRDHCVYDLDGHASEISLGALLETMAIAASGKGLRMRSQLRPGSPVGHPTFDVCFEPEAALSSDPLIDFIRTRSVQRRPMRMTPLTSEQKAALEASVGQGYCVSWFEDLGARWRMARLLFRFAGLRLTMPEAYAVHRDIIEWGARYSEDRIPDQALGVDRLTLQLMRFVLRSWGRVRFFNRFLAGTWMPRLQMDLIPGLACASHFLIIASTGIRTTDDYVSAGRQVQRFWLTAASLGLLVQPTMTPLIFARYLREQVPFTNSTGLRALARRLSLKLTEVVGTENIPRTVFMGRMGVGPTSQSRSLRKPLTAFITRGNQ